MSWTTALFFAGNVLYCVSYTVRDIFWLRLFAVAAALATLPYYATAAGEPLWQAVFWATMYLLINGVNLALLLRERRPVQLDPDQRRLHETTFRSYSPRELVRLLASARWVEARPGEQIIGQGERLDSLLFLDRGRVRVEIDGELHAVREDQRFLGEFSWISGEAASATVIAEAPCRMLRWVHDDIAQLFERHPDMKGLWNVIISRNLKDKLLTPGGAAGGAPGRPDIP